MALACGCFLLDAAKHVWLLSAGPVQPWPDSAAYWRLGQDAAAGDLWLWQSATAARTPLYPYFLAACQVVGRTRALWLAVIVQHLLEMAVSLLIAGTVWESTRSRRAAIVAYGLCILLTARCLFANSILTESWATFLLALLMWLLCRGLAAGGWPNLLFASVVLGFSILLRPAAAAFLPALVYVAWQSAQETSGRRFQATRVVVAVGLCVAMTLPWCWRNQLLWNRFTVTVMLGRELWTATFSPWTGANLDLPPTASGHRIRTLTELPETTLRRNWTVHTALTRAGLTEVEADELMKAVALEAIERQPYRAAVHVGARCLAFWYVKDWEVDVADFASQQPWQDQRGWSSPQRQEFLRTALRFTPERSFCAIWLWTAATWLGVAGMLISAPHRNFGITVAGLMLGLTLLTAVLEIPLYRYRCVLEPAMITAMVIGGNALRLASPGRRSQSGENLRNQPR